MPVLGCVPVCVMPLTEFALVSAVTGGLFIWGIILDRGEKDL